MPAPSRLSIATSAVNRLLKEEITYRKELSSQEERLRQMQETNDNDENREFNLNQEVWYHYPAWSSKEGKKPTDVFFFSFLFWKKKKTSIEETKAVFGPLRERLVASTEKLESILVSVISLESF